MDKEDQKDDTALYPSSQTTKNGKGASWYPVPIQLVDTFMPRLRDTELRVLLVVLRQTWGWKADRTKTSSNAGSSQRTNVNRATKSNQATNFNRATKRRDWLSHSQLCRRTGRGSDAVSSAVASLTKAGLIIVEDAGGRPLLTPEERRRCLGRLYFRPGEMWSNLDANTGLEEN